jgi:hypothetical protein
MHPARMQPAAAFHGPVKRGFGRTAARATVLANYPARHVNGKIPYFYNNVGFF